MSDQIVMLVAGGFFSLLSTFLTGICFFLMKQASAALKELRQESSALTTKMAVTEAKHENLLGNLAALATSQTNITKDVGRLTASVEKVWQVMQRAKLTERRMSDELVDEGLTAKKG